VDRLAVASRGYEAFQPKPCKLLRNSRLPHHPLFRRDGPIVDIGGASALPGQRAISVHDPGKLKPRAQELLRATRGRRAEMLGQESSVGEMGEGSGTLSCAPSAGGAARDHRAVIPQHPRPHAHSH
jgi:hypothetical protein